MLPYDIHKLLKTAYTEHASDLHITVDSPPIYRMNGELRSFDNVLLTGATIEKMARRIVKKDDWETLIEDGEIDIAYSLEGVARFRINVYVQRNQIGFAARVISSEIPTIEQLQMPMILQKMSEKPHGLIIVTGPTGSGKSTTLAAMIDYINRNYSKHIITLEDPIEYMHNHLRSIVHQREIGSDTKSFSSGLRAALRQDPDVILVGEMRDLETISTAITAAETGHLVLATLHTNNASQTIDRIIDVFPPHQQKQIRLQLAAVLEGIISQRLFPRMDGAGRIAATEILINHPSIANLIRNEKVEQIQNIMQTSRASGMHTLEMSISELLAGGIISNDAAKPYLVNVGDYEWQYSNM
ncbi:type IV pilus twitching motility protein PilT [Bacillus sp. FJAT-50079]|uniref:type IV pilus twitching motility protein PilT n=1 Tax=Bacillus sp. FJAT-50079 TaxID=2833577 RepID=UPI001BC91FB5|nr:type IV pilus twitching motility protein PilT [Bacillus sp. FJAT-50079]MBS4208944.1 type IV pilus twitching motility protein PilT [Bacillus sp. FJAT-50079]